MAALVLAVVFALQLVAGPEPTGAALPWRHADLEDLYVAQRFDEGLARAKARLRETPDDAHLYGHAARFLYEIGERHKRTDTTVDKQALYAEMHALLERGVALEPTHPHLLFGLGLAKARLATTRGVLASLGTAKEIEGLWTRVAQDTRSYRSRNGENQLPCDAMLSLGVFYRMLPDWWIVEVIAGTRGDLDKSLALLARADRCGPDRIRTLKELGVAQLCAGERRDDATMTNAGRASLRRVLALPVRLPTEHIDVRHARMLLDDASLACGYSRDGQQALDERALDAAPGGASVDGGAGVP